jgi:arylsulfatase A
MAPELLGRGGQQKPREFLYFEFPEGGGQLAVRLGRWKGVKTGLKANPRAPWQLYDLETDAAERTDVGASHPDILERLDAIVAREHRHPHIREWEFVDSKMPTGTR